MSSPALEALRHNYPKLEPVLALLNDESCNGAVMLVSEDPAVSDDAEALARNFAQNPIIIGGATIRIGEWRAQMEEINPAERQTDMFTPERQERLCLVVLGLDETPEKIVAELKGMLENSARKVLCVVSVTNENRLPKFMPSHFYRLHRRKRPGRPPRR